MAGKPKRTLPYIKSVKRKEVPSGSKVRQGRVYRKEVSANKRCFRSAEATLRRYRNRTDNLAKKLVSKKLSSPCISTITTKVTLNSILQSLKPRCEPPIGDYKLRFRLDPTNIRLERSTIVQDSEGVALACLLKGINPPEVNTKISRVLIDFANTYCPPHSKFAENRTGASTRKGYTYHICSGWIGLGSEGREPNPSATFLQSVKAFSANLELLEELRFTTSATNHALEFVDPALFEMYKVSTESDHVPLAVRATRVNDDSVWLGKAVLINEHTGWHRDIGDLGNGWCALAYFGDFKDGDLCLPELKIRLYTQPGDIILLRSAALIHFVDNWIGDGRYVIVYFTHGNVILSDHKD